MKYLFSIDEKVDTDTPRGGVFAQYYRGHVCRFFEYAASEVRLIDVASFVRVLAQRHGTYRDARRCSFR